MMNFAAQLISLPRGLSAAGPFVLCGAQRSPVHPGERNELSSSA